jgi:hypothetical protein
MTAPDPEPLPERPLPETLAASPVPEPLEKPENEIVSWVKAIAFGIRDTAEDMLEEGRRVAHEAYNSGWNRFDAKTRHRRAPRQ